MLKLGDDDEQMIDKRCNAVQGVIYIYIASVIGGSKRNGTFSRSVDRRGLCDWA
jgi:hypothetical protein